MLARNFLTADRLKICEQYHVALIKLLGMMERGEITHVKEDKHGEIRNSEEPHGFNMGHWRVDSDCGTVCCIGGWMLELLGRSYRLDPGSVTPALSALFNPEDVWTVDMADITVDQAAHALRNYLATGKPKWERVLA